MREQKIDYWREHSDQFEQEQQRLRAQAAGTTDRSRAAKEE